MTRSSRDPLYRRHRFPAEVIAHAVWLYFRFPLSLRMVEDLMAARGIIVSHQSVRLWGERPVSGFCRSGKSGDVLALEPALVLTLIPERRGCMARMEIMSGSERRRRRSDEAKLRILAEADQPGVRIGDVARRHDIYPSQIRLWRQSFSYVGQPAMFLPVEITEEASATQAPDTPPTPALIEISLRNGRCLRVPADIELRMLGSLIACVEAA